LGLALALASMILLGRAAFNLAHYHLTWLDFGPKIAYAADRQDLIFFPQGSYSYGTTRTASTTNGGQITNVEFIGNVSGQCTNGAQIGHWIEIRQAVTDAFIASSSIAGIYCGAGHGLGPDFQLNRSVFVYQGESLGITFNIVTSSAGCTLGSCAGVGPVSAGVTPIGYASGIAAGQPNLFMWWPGIFTATSSVPDFENWLVSAAGLASDGVIDVISGNDPGAMVLNDNSELPLVDGLNKIQKHNVLWQPGDPNPIDWYAQPIYTKGATTIYGDVLHFTVNPNGGGMAPFEGSGDVVFRHYFISTSTPPSAIQCKAPTGGLLDDPIGNINAALCAAFKPNQSTLNSYSQLGTDLSTKPPFGYFGAVKAGLVGLAATTTALSFMDASTTATFAPVFTPIRTGFSVVILALAGFWIWNRIRHLEI